MKKVLKKIINLIFLNLSFNIFALETDISIFYDMNSAFNSGFYPGTIQYAERLIQNFPESIYISNAYFQKGVSLLNLKNFEESENSLKDGLKVCEKKSNLYYETEYFLANCYENQKKYNEALILYFDYCKNNKNGKYFDSAILNSGKVFYYQKEFNSAIKNFEYVLQNGKKFNKISYEDSLLKICDSYNKSKNQKKTVELFNKIPFENLSDRTKIIFRDFTADAYNLLGEYKKSYDLYCENLLVAENENKSNALKKAYKLSSEHKNEIKENPGRILQIAQENFTDSDKLLCEFWIRMAIDELNQKNFNQSEEYLKEAEKKALNSEKEFIYLVRAENEFLKESSEKSAKTAEKILNSAEKELNLNSESKYFLDYQKSHIKYLTFSKDFNSAAKKIEILSELDDDSKYYLALAFYNLGDFEKSVQILENSTNSLKALSFLKLQNHNEALKIFDELNFQDKLNDEQRLNYSKILLYSGRYRESQIQAAKCSQNEAKYILALAQFNTKNWNFAEKNLESFLNNKIKDKKAKSYAEFYLGYSKYKLSKNKEAYKILDDFTKKYQNHELIWNAEVTCANAAIQIREFENAMKHSENAVKKSKNAENREEAVMLCAQILVDSDEIQKANEFLAPYSTVKNEFGAKCLFQIAKNYEKLQNLEQAEKNYLKIIENFPKTQISEESYYRRGELYYSFADFEKALNRFSEYNQKFPGGIFIESSVFYTADCLKNLKNNDRAILQLLSFIKTYPESNYAYISQKNLMELYRETDKIENSIKTAEFILQKYPEKAKIDKIQTFYLELKQLQTGYSEEILNLQKRFADFEKTKTQSGRIIGTELAENLVKNEKFYNEGVNLSEELFKIQENKTEESLYAAKNAMILAENYKKLKNNKKSAEFYLKSALFFKQSQKSEEAASSLYNAYSDFLACGMETDAEACKNLLLKEYPKSKYSESIRNR